MPALAQKNVPPDPCASVAAPQKTACYRQHFSTADGELNAVYKRLYASLEPQRRSAMQEHSRAWIAYKESLCLESTAINSSLDPAQVKNSAEYFACLYDMTRARTAYLKSAFAGEGVSPGLAGTYDDGFGGTLTLKLKATDRYDFHIEVVRGPTYHTGDVEGTIQFSTATTTFVQRDDCGRDTPCCRLTFKRQPLHIDVAEDSCHMLHGARAYFSGAYRKVK